MISPLNHLESTKFAYESFSDLDDPHFIVERDGLAFETFVDEDQNEVSVLFSGINKIIYFQKNLRAEPKSLTSYEEGVKKGDAFEWWPNGNLKAFRTYVEGKEQGLSCLWHLNGKIAYESGRIKGMVNGISRAWDDDGFQTREVCWSNGELCGYRIIWYRPSRGVEYLYDEGGAGIFECFNRPDQSAHFTFIPKRLKQSI